MSTSSALAVMVTDGFFNRRTPIAEIVDDEMGWREMRFIL
jgi:hypothetical protein